MTASTHAMAEELLRQPHGRISFGPALGTRLLFFPVIALALLLCSLTLTNHMGNVFGGPSPDWAIALAFLLGIPTLIAATIELPGAYRWSMTDTTLSIRTFYRTREEHWADVMFHERPRIESAYHRTLRGKDPGLGAGHIGRPIWEGSLFKGRGAHLTPPWIILATKKGGFLVPNIFPYRAYDFAEVLILHHHKNGQRQVSPKKMVALK